ncbi:MAG: glycosyltransferase [Actinomycetota bacterium]|nr:glycosyltransferase [Actinomycetota bacterium]
MAVVIVTRDRAPELLTSLDLLGSLPERPEIVVVDNASSDGTPAVVRREYPEVEVVALEENLGAAGRNIGVGRVDAPYVAFSDDDSWWESGTLAEAADLFDSHPRLGLLAGRILVGPQQREDPICAEMASGLLTGEPDLPGPPVLGFLACAAIVRRSAYLSVGGFDPRLMIGGEEALVAADLAAAGWGLAYVEDVVAHHHPSTIRDRRSRRRNTIRNDLWFAWLRRPLSAAARHTFCAARASLRDADARTALIDALGSLPWVLKKRRVLPRRVEADLRALDRHRWGQALTG